jgi:hypothetical protein
MSGVKKRFFGRKINLFFQIWRQVRPSGKNIVRASGKRHWQPNPLSKLVSLLIQSID